MSQETEVTPTKEEAKIGDLIARKKGNVSSVAKSLKISRKTLYVKIRASEFLQDMLEDARETMLDDAEDGLNGAIKKGEAWAICFALKTQGKKRGYVERIEQTGADGGAIKVENAEQNLSNLTTEELLTLKSLQEKLNNAV